MQKQIGQGSGITLFWSQTNSFQIPALTIGCEDLK